MNTGTKKRNEKGMKKYNTSQSCLDIRSGIREGCRPVKIKSNSNLSFVIFVEKFTSCSVREERVVSHYIISKKREGGLRGR
jgi:hypothetical protein